MICIRCHLFPFLNSCGGNWRNSLFIECHKKACGRRALCEGFLLAMDSDGRPIVADASELGRISGQEIDRNECAGILSRGDFEVLYAQWLRWTIDDPRSCALRMLAGKRTGAAIPKKCNSP